MIQTPSPEQIPAPPLPPEIPPEIFTHAPPVIMTGDEIVKIVVFSILGVAAIVWIVARSPIGHAIGEGLKRLFGVAPAGQMLPGEVEELRRRLDDVQHQLGELAERQDFAERMLAQVRREKALPGAEDVQR